MARVYREKKQYDKCWSSSLGDTCFKDADVWVVLENLTIEPMCFHHWNQYWNNPRTGNGIFYGCDSLEEALLVGTVMME